MTTQERRIQAFADRVAKLAKDEGLTVAICISGRIDGKRFMFGRLQGYLGDLIACSDLIRSEAAKAAANSTGKATLEARTQEIQFRD
jgi:hypothetical protein